MTILIHWILLLYCSGISNIKANNECGGQGWTYDQSNGQCFKFFNDEQRWCDARAACKDKYSAELALPKNQDENIFISSLIPNQATKIWINALYWCGCPWGDSMATCWEDQSKLTYFTRLTYSSTEKPPGCNPKDQFHHACRGSLHKNGDWDAHDCAEGDDCSYSERGVEPWSLRDPSLVTSEAKYPYICSKFVEYSATVKDGSSKPSAYYASGSEVTFTCDIAPTVPSSPVTESYYESKIDYRWVKQLKSDGTEVDLTPFSKDNRNVKLDITDSQDWSGIKCEVGISVTSCKYKCENYFSAVSTYVNLKVYHSCADAVELGDAWRNVMTSSADDVSHCDRDVIRPGVKFKVTLGGVPAVIPGGCVRNNQCGTKVGLRLHMGNATLPQVVGSMVEASLCGAYDVLGRYDCCVLRTPVTVLRCEVGVAYILHDAIDRCDVAVCAHVPGVVIPESYLARHGDVYDDGGGQDCAGETVGFYCFELIKQSENWQMAKKICSEGCRRGFLAEAHTPEEAESIERLRTTYGQNWVIWVGGYEVSEQGGQWEWMNSKKPIPLQDSEGFHMWRKHEPNRPGKQHCLQWQKRGKDGGHWVDDYCRHRKAFVCQYPLDTGSLDKASGGSAVHAAVAMVASSIMAAVVLTTVM